jgi:hypothetical protein
VYYVTETIKAQNCFFKVQIRVAAVAQKDRSKEQETAWMGSVKREDSYETNEKGE